MEGIGPLFGPCALARFDRDVLAQPGVHYVVVLLGINDIGLPRAFARPEEDVSVAEMIAGYRQLFARALPGLPDPPPEPLLERVLRVCRLVLHGWSPRLLGSRW